MPEARVLSSPSDDRLLKLEDVIEITLLSRASVYRGIEEGTFPRPMKFGAASRWSMREVQAWIADRLADREATSAA